MSNMYGMACRVQRPHFSVARLQTNLSQAKPDLEKQATNNRERVHGRACVAMVVIK